MASSPAPRSQNPPVRPPAVTRTASADLRPALSPHARPRPQLPLSWRSVQRVRASPWPHPPRRHRSPLRSPEAARGRVPTVCLHLARKKHPVSVGGGGHTHQAAWTPDPAPRGPSGYGGSGWPDCPGPQPWPLPVGGAGISRRWACLPYLPSWGRGLPSRCWSSAELLQAAVD